MSRKSVIKNVKTLAEKYVQDKEIELVDVEFVKEGHHRYLRVIMDKDEGISLDECSEVSRFLSKKLDELDLIMEEYFLEVTSPGITRALRKDSEYNKYAGHEVQVKLYHPIDGRKLFTGILKGLKDNNVTIDVEEEVVTVAKDKIAKINLTGN